MQVFDFMSKDRENAFIFQIGYVPCYNAYVFVFQLDDISGVVFATTIGYYDFYPRTGQSQDTKRGFCFISAKMAKHEIFWRKFKICLTRSQNDVFEYRVTINCCLVQYLICKWHLQLDVKPLLINIILIIYNDPSVHIKIYKNKASKP